MGRSLPRHAVGIPAGRRPIGIDLFAGAGGMSLGFEQAGFDVAAAVEVDPIHAAVHSRNFPHCAVIPRSVADLTGNAIRRLAGIGGRDVDVVFGGAPCQGFSMIGRRAFDDPRNGLVREFVRLTAELEARSFVFENVRGLTVGRHREFLHDLIAEFGRLGYSVAVPWRVLNAVHYGVPQNRHRLILMGVRRGLPLPRYPAPTNGDPGRPGPGLPPGPTCADALGDLPEAEDYPELLSCDEVETDAWGPPSAYAAPLRGLGNDAWAFARPRIWNPLRLTSSTLARHTAISRRRFAATVPGTVEPISRFHRLSAEGVANTLRAGTDSSRGAFTSPRPIHYARARCVTVREMARLHGFPDWFRLHRTKWHGARQIGNAVPPPLARAVASEMIGALGFVPTRPSEAVAPGGEDLLGMGMAEAARHWDVPVAIASRDRRSGDGKRRQADIPDEPVRRKPAFA